MQKLSNYTHPRFCTDEIDLLTGLQEIEDAMDYCRRTDRKIPDYYYIRKWKLEKKLKKITTKGLKNEEFRYRGHIFQAERQFKAHEDFGYVGRRLTRLNVDGWNWDEFWLCANTIGHRNLSLKHADIFLMDKSVTVIPCENFLGQYTTE